MIPMHRFQHPWAVAILISTVAVVTSGLFWTIFSPTSTSARFHHNTTILLSLSLTILNSILLVLLYRLTLHPLACHPGPLLGSLTDWHTIYHLSTASRHLALDAQHKRHGPIVRYGPNRISFCSPEASRALGSVHANVLRSRVFSSFRHFFGVDSSATTLDPREHAFRRRVNSEALRAGSMPAYERRVVPHVDAMMHKLRLGAEEGRWGPPHDMTRVLTDCVADIMADVVFGQPNAGLGRQIGRLAGSTTGLLIVGHMQMAIRLKLHWLLFLPFIRSMLQFLLLAQSLVSRRRHRGAAQTDRNSQSDQASRDIWSVLLSAKDIETGRPYTLDQLTSEAGLFVQAGTGTTILTATSVLFYLVRDRSVLARATAEVRSLDREDIAWGRPALQKLRYLDACIHEAMRLSPSLAGISPRTAGKGGVLLDGTWFPEGTELGVPFYSLYRRLSCFAADAPTVYKPERWLPTEDGGQGLTPASGAAAAFTPFGQGRFGCLGRHLAMGELRLILARMLWVFDLRQEPGNNSGGGQGSKAEGRECEREFQLWDRFVADGRGPSVQFRERVVV